MLAVQNELLIYTHISYGWDIAFLRKACKRSYRKSFVSLAMNFFFVSQLQLIIITIYLLSLRIYKLFGFTNLAAVVICLPPLIHLFLVFSERLSIYCVLSVEDTRYGMKLLLFKLGD